MSNVDSAELLSTMPKKEKDIQNSSYLSVVVKNLSIPRYLVQSSKRSLELSDMSDIVLQGADPSLHIKLSSINFRHDTQLSTANFVSLTLNYL